MKFIIRNSRFKVIGLTALFAIFLIIPHKIYANDWPNYREDPENTGFNTDNITVPLALKWASPDSTVEENGLIGIAGTVYQGKSGPILGYDLFSGQQVQTYNFVNIGESTPAASDNRLYVLDMGGSNAYVKCIDIGTGSVLWTSNALVSMASLRPPSFNSLVVDDLYVYIQCGYGPPWTHGIWVYDKNTGAIKSGFPVSFTTTSSNYTSMPGLCADNYRIFYYDTATTEIYGYDINGNVLANFPINVPAYSSDYIFTRPVVYNNEIFVYAHDSNLTDLKIYVYDISTGLPLTGFPVNAGTSGGSYNNYGGIAAANNVVYALDGTSELYAFDMNTGNPMAGFPVFTTSANRIISSPAISGNNIVFVAVGDSKKIFAISGAGNADAGTILWQYQITGGDSQGFDFNSPIIFDNYLLISLDSGGIWAFGPDLTLCKTVDKKITYQGDILQYFLNINSMGSSSTKTGVVLADTIPACAQYISGSATDSPILNGNLLIWNIGDVVANTILSYSFMVQVNPSCPTGTTITNQAIIYANGLGPYESNMVNSIINPGPSPTLTNTETTTPTILPTFTNTETMTPSAIITLTVTPTPTASITCSVTIIPTPQVPLCLKLYKNSPNPCSNGTNIIYQLCDEAQVNVKIYTISGEVVREFTQQGQPDMNSIYWDTNNKTGKGVASGIFIYSIEAIDSKEHQKSWGKMAVVK